MRSTKYLFLLAFVAITLLLACKRKKEHISICGKENPMENISWLKTKITDYKNRHYTGTLYTKVSKDTTFVGIQLDMMSCYVCEIYTCDGTSISQGTFTRLNMEMSSAEAPKWNKVARF